MITGKWAFDIIYEFVYQFQEACQYRASAVRSTEQRAESSIDCERARRGALFIDVVWDGVYGGMDRSFRSIVIGC